MRRLSEFQVSLGILIAIIITMFGVTIYRTNMSNNDVLDRARNDPDKNVATLGKGSSVSNNNTGTPAVNHHARIERRVNVVDKATFFGTHFAFIMGIEGVGHHGIGAMFKACTQCSIDEVCTKLLYKGGERPTGIFVYGQNSIKSIESARRDFVDRIHYLQSEQDSRLYVLNTVEFKGTNIGMLSYPNYNGMWKSMHHPDAPLLAEMMEEAGADLRIVVLLRGARDVLKSTTMKRHIGGNWKTEAAILSDNAAIMVAQLELLDPKFFVCVKYEDLRYPWLWTERLGPFLHEHIAWSVSNMLDSFHGTLENLSHDGILEIHSVTDGKGINFDDDDPYLMHLERITNLIEDICRHTNRLLTPSSS